MLAYGNIAGSYSAGRDASAATYSDFIASLTAGRDIGSMYGGDGVWARGDVRGAIVAEGSVAGEVFAFGNIQAAIYAPAKGTVPFSRPDRVVPAEYL